MYLEYLGSTYGKVNNFHQSLVLTRIKTFNTFKQIKLFLERRLSVDKLFLNL